MPSRPGEFHPEPLTDPDLILSHHPARATARRLPPSVELRAPPVASWPDSSSMTRPLRSTTITAASSLLRSSPPLSGASVLSALRFAPLGPFPLASPFLTRAWLSFAPSTCRMPLGQYQHIHP